MDGFLIGRVRGIDLRINWSVMVIAVLVTWSLADSVLPEFAEGRSERAYWVAAAVTAVAFFVSLVAHELGHALVAGSEGVAVERITLWLFGGVAQLGQEPESPRAALRIAAAGPIVSATIGIVAVAAGAMLDGLPKVAVMWLGVMNLVLMAFNLLPAYPLDGGRIYQAIAWKRTGDRAGSTARAANAGLTVGAILVGIGILEILVGAFVGGVWLMLIGWFLREAARAERREATIGGQLAAMPVARIMTPEPLTVRADVSLQDFVAGVFFGGRHAAYPVVGADGRVAGLITLDLVRNAPGGAHATATVGDLAVALDDVLVVAPATSVSELQHEMAVGRHRRALVFDEEDLVGIISPSDVARLITVVELAVPAPTAGRAPVTSPG